MMLFFATFSAWGLGWLGCPDHIHDCALLDALEEREVISGASICPQLGRIDLQCSAEHVTDIKKAMPIKIATTPKSRASTLNVIKKARSNFMRVLSTSTCYLQSSWRIVAPIFMSANHGIS
jgi:hypothetical protein